MHKLFLRKGIADNVLGEIFQPLLVVSLDPYLVIPFETGNMTLTFRLVTDDEDYGKIVSSPNFIECNGAPHTVTLYSIVECSADFNLNYEVTLTANDISGDLDWWLEDCIYPSNLADAVYSQSINVTIEGDITLCAPFKFIYDSNLNIGFLSYICLFLLCWLIREITISATSICYLPPLLLFEVLQSPVNPKKYGTDFLMIC